MSDAAAALRSLALLCGLALAAAIAGMFELTPIAALGPVGAWAAALLVNRAQSQAAWVTGLLLGFAGSRQLPP
jgi:hypothetical protein